jgi:hypothetical protein
MRRAQRPGATVSAAEVVQPIEIDEPPVTDWALRPFAAAPASPLRVGAALAIGYAALSWAARFALGATPHALSWRDPFVWLDFLNGVLFAYIPTALWRLRAARLRDLRELRPSLREGPELRRLIDAALGVPPLRLAVAGLVGAVALGVLPLVDPGFWEFERPPAGDPLVLFFMARMAVSGWLGGHALVTEASAIAAYVRLGARHVRVDLFDLRPFEVFARSGLRSAFTWVLMSSLISLFWLGPGAGVANAFIVMGILVAVSAAVFASVYGAHRAIAAARREALASVEARIGRAGAALLAGREPDARLTDLVAWHGYLLRVREWPLGAPVLARGALIAALGLGSWLGGALVERALDRLFG